MKPKISVIVPVYNVEPYLKRCLDSIINQSMKEIEIIVIDDGSTDGSEEICDEYAKLDNRIKVIHQQNGGVSCARNVGLEHVQSKYIMFVDPDDYVDRFYCQLPYEIAEINNYDIVIFCSRTFLKGVELSTKKTTLMEGEITKQDIFSDLSGRIRNSMWNKLFSKDLFDGVSFPIGKYHEDVFVLHKLILKAKSIYFSHSCLYNYVKREGSLTNTQTLERCFDCIEAYYEQMRCINEHGYSLSLSVRNLKRELRYLACFGYDDKLSYKCIELIKCFNLDKYKKSLKPKARLLLYLCLNHRYLFDLICKIKNLRGNIPFYLLQ